MGRPSRGGETPTEGSALFSEIVEIHNSNDRRLTPPTGVNGQQEIEPDQNRKYSYSSSGEPKNLKSPIDGAQKTLRDSAEQRNPGRDTNIISEIQGYGLDAKAITASGDARNLRRCTRRPGRREALSGAGKIAPEPAARPKAGKVNSARTNKPNQKRNRHKPAQTAGSNGQEKYAALDLGTNNCRLLIAVPEQRGSFRIIDAFSRIVRLGEGLEGSGILSEDAINRAIDALIICANKLKYANVHHQRLIATEACRRAINGAEFLSRVKARTGLDLEIVDRRTEALLAAEGCCSLVDRKADGAVLFDIGGGSSELVLLDCKSGNRKKISELVSSWTSLPIGVVTLSERHGGREVSKQIFQNMVRDVEDHLSKFEERNKLAEFWDRGSVHLLGTSGTVTTLAGVHLNLARYDRKRVDGIWLNEEQVDEITKKLLAMSYEERAKNPCIGRDRADLVLAGCAILQAIRNTWPAPRLRVADRGLREGLLTQMMEQYNAWGRSGKNNKQRSRKQRNQHRYKKRQNHHTNPAVEGADTPTGNG